MAQEPPEIPEADPLAAERARLREAARALEEERQRLRRLAEETASGQEERRRRPRGCWPFFALDPELVDWWRANRPSRVLLQFLRDLPDEFLEHLRAARREQLLALRTFVDYALEYNERTGRRRRERGPREVPIEQG
ncbi:MAG TPA: hypothetical protein VFB73_01610 [Chloroflexota bacterium]|nr:hypothetical protein [Chloroflexota bacterium]